jgi:hypothetical protein
MVAAHHPVPTIAHNTKKAARLIFRQQLLIPDSDSHSVVVCAAVWNFTVAAADQ